MENPTDLSCCLFGISSHYFFVIENFCLKECGAGNEDNAAFQLYASSCAKPQYYLFKPTLDFHMP